MIIKLRVETPHLQPSKLSFEQDILPYDHWTHDMWVRTPHLTLQPMVLSLEQDSLLTLLHPILLKKKREPEVNIQGKTDLFLLEE